MEPNFDFGINASVFVHPDPSNTLSISERFAVPNFNMSTSTRFPFLNDSESSKVHGDRILHDNYRFANNTNNFEWWQAFDSQYLIFNLTWTVVAIVAYLIILIVGLLGNSLVILTYIRRPKMRTVTNLFILNLAVADTMAVLFCFLGNLLSNTIKPWILGDFMCKMVAYVQGMSVCASAYLLAAISVDRCKAVYRPLDRPPGLRRRQAICAVVIIWCSAICLPLPWLFTLTTVTEKGLTYCDELWGTKLHGQVYFLLVNVLAYYVLPTIFIIVTNVMISYRVSRREVPTAIASSDAIRLMHRQTRNDVRKMLLIVTFVFLLSWLPLYVSVIRYRYFSMGKMEKRAFHVILPLAQWLASCNSSINPLIYAYLNGKFRAAFQSLMPSCLKFLRRDGPSTSSMRTFNNRTVSSARNRLQRLTSKASFNFA